MSAVLVLAAPAGGQDVATTAREAIAAIAAEEAAQAGGRLTTSVTERRGKYESGEKLEDTKKRIGKEDAVPAEGSLAYGPAGWSKSLTIPAAQDRPRTQTRTVEAGGLLRMLVTAGAGGAEERRGWVLRVSTPTPADAVLTRRVARALEGIQWDLSQAQGDLLTLEGRRGGERHSLVLRKQPRVQVRRWTLARSLVGPSGEALEQTYVADVTPGEAPGSVGKVEEWVLNPPPAANVAYRLTEVRRFEPQADLKPEELSLPFPRGTLVTDARTGAPVEYEIADEKLSDSEIASAVTALSEGRAKPGEPAPAFELKDPKGKTVRLRDYAGKIVVLYWFSSRSKPAEQTAPFMQDLAGRYKSGAVQFLAINTAEERDAAKRAEAFRKRFKWSFPVAVDETNDLVRRYGAETAVPKVAIVDAAGRLVYVQAGVDPDDITDRLDRLVGPAR